MIHARPLFDKLGGSDGYGAEAILKLVVR
jgi:hypothetical protein